MQKTKRKIGFKVCKFKNVLHGDIGINFLMTNIVLLC
jgi:hypothetical protein